MPRTVSHLAYCFIQPSQDFRQIVLFLSLPIAVTIATRCPIKNISYWIENLSTQTRNSSNPKTTNSCFIFSLHVQSR